MANIFGALMGGAPIGALDIGFPFQAQTVDPFQAAIEARRTQMSDVQGEIERLKGDKLGALGRALSATVAGYHGQDPSAVLSPYQNQLGGLQQQQRQLGAGIEDLTLQRYLQERKGAGGVGNYNPRDYTADSWATFVQGGLRDPSVLVRHDPFTQGGVRYVPDGQGGVVPVVSEQQQLSAGQIQAEIDRLRAMQKEIGTRTGEVTTAEDVAGARGAIAAEEARSTTQAKGEEQRAQGIIQRGLEAAEASPTIRRSLELLDSVGTGGFERAAIAARQSLGIESANEAELSNNLATNVLGQLRSTFGAAFTEREGERLERIEAGIGKSTEGNRRLLEQALRMTERAAERAIKAAEARGDYETADEIRDVMAFTPQPELGGGQQSAKEVPIRNAQGWQLMTDAQGNRAYVGPNGEVEEI